MLTCLCDAYYGEVGVATVKVLEHVGCQVCFDQDQTCCGQPAFNAGDWDEARAIAGHSRDIFSKSALPIVVPSSSCTAMLRNGYSMLSVDTMPAFELAEFLVKEMGLVTWPAARGYPHKIALHRACHGRGIGLRNEQELLLASIPELELMPLAQAEQCCGFGGSFCVAEGKLSSEIGLEKLKMAMESGATELVSGDMGCLMHLQGLIARAKLPLRVRHFAEILAEVIEA